MNKTLTLILCLLSLQVMADSSEVEFSGGWIKQLPPVVPMRAGYVKISNSSKQDAVITAMQSDAFESVELHETLMQDGMMKMVELESFVIPAKGSTELKPGGKHIMLINPLRPLAIGDKIDLIVTFGDAKAQKIQLEVKQ